MIPYVTPTDLLGDPSAPASVTGPSDQATLGVNFSTISLARLWEMCYIATQMVDAVAAQTLRGASFYEELAGPGHRLGMLPNATARFVTSRKPILSVVSGQVTYGPPPWQWNAIPVANIVLEAPVFSDFTSAAWEAADPGQAALLIGGCLGWNGHMGTRVGIRYLSGWPVTGLTPTATPSATFTVSSNSVTVGSATGIVVGAAVVAPAFVPSGTTVTDIVGTTLTLSANATASGSGTLTVGYAPGVTTLNVDDITTWGLGVRGTIYDGLSAESVTSTAVGGTTMTPTPVGPGTITLAAPTLFAHPAMVTLSAMPGAIRWATMLAVKVQALERGSTAVTAQATPGRSTGAGGSAVTRTNQDIQRLLLPYRRVW